jgi:hypothetical protein
MWGRVNMLHGAGTRLCASDVARYIIIIIIIKLLD